MLASPPPATPGRADFFVHPDYHRLIGGAVTEEIARYEAALHDRIDNSELPILIHDTGSGVKTGGFWDRFPDEQRFPTEKGAGLLATDPRTQERFDGLLDEHQVVEGLVHGSYLAQCVKAFKSKLRASAPSGVLYYRSVYNIGNMRDTTHPDTVKFGLVLRSSNCDYLSSQSPHSSPNLSPHYAQDAQVFHTF